MRYEIIPILMQEYEDVLLRQVEELRSWEVEGLRVQLDVVDGVFAPVSLVRPDVLRAEQFDGLVVDVQLMVVEPVEWLAGVYTMGAKRVYGHIERMGNREEFLREAQEYGLEVGWGMDLYTPVDELSDQNLEAADGILLMSVKTGKSGQEFNTSVFDKIKQLRERGYGGDVCIDGGVNEETMMACIEAGANHLSMNSALWESFDMRHTYEELVAKVKAYE